MMNIQLGICPPGRVEYEVPASLEIFIEGEVDEKE
jgi:hypothetical protein